ncbi:MAG: hypothetical protein DRG33_04890 [Deltaproteobacteria bacterium]|nr:MAG: hypothetical protein DRG33_04890 [Deltaproteobacteria bacterium]
MHKLLNPKSIAFFGASNSFFTMGTTMALNIKKSGIKLYPVHPREEKVIGLKAYKSVEDLPEVPDLAIFVIPARAVLEEMEKCGEFGINRAIVVSGGFSEIGEEGETFEKELVSVANKHKIRFLGPNTLGIYNAHNNLNTMWFPFPPEKGGISLIAQSGTIANHTFPMLRRLGYKFSKIISIGNEADIDIVDCLEYLMADLNTKSIAMYIEGVRRFKEFMNVAGEATKVKPVVALYAGGTEAGARACKSHTAAITGKDEIYDGMFKQCGILRAKTIDELFDWAFALSVQPTLKGKKIGILTDSGGSGACMADCCERIGLEIPLLSPEVQNELRKHASKVGFTKNPVDLTFDLDPSKFYEKIPKILLKNVDGLLCYGIFGSKFFEEIKKFASSDVNVPVDEIKGATYKFIEKLPKISTEYNKPIIGVSFVGREDDAVAFLQDHGIPVYPTPERAAGAMKALYVYSILKDQQMRKQTRELKRKREDKKKITTLMENESKELLEEYGIKTAKCYVAATKREAVELAKEIGFPVVLKILSPDVVHKSDIGGVKLNLRNESEVERAYEEIIANAKKVTDKITGVTVQKMLDGGIELAVGVIKELNCGHVITFGLGGVFVEVLKDVSYRVIPIHEVDAESMIEEIRGYRILAGHRGMKADIDSLKSLLIRVSDLIEDHPEISELDLNPVFANPDGCVVVDARIFVS